MDWRTLTDDPAHDPRAKIVVRNDLINKREIKDVELISIFKDACRGKRVLDIGICEHDIGHMNADGWKHKEIASVASYILGADIIEDLVSVLKSKGYNVVCCDCTSDRYLGETFDTVIVGDVIEHVDNPVNLLKFCKRHLAAGGKILVSTPNPFFMTWYKHLWRDGTFLANLEHVSWITPTNALEIAYRAGLKLTKYYVPELGLPRRNIAKRWLMKKIPIEMRAGYYVYQFEA